MADNILQYLENTKSGFNESGFNEMDGMIMSNLSYIRFEDVNWNGVDWENGISMREYAERILDSEIDIDENQTKLLELLKDSSRYNECKIKNPAACNENQMWDCGNKSTIIEDSQWAALTMEIDGKPPKSVVAMRGTDGTEFGWSEDFELGYDKNGSTAQRLSRDYLNACDNADEIILAGHSKGGNDCTAGYMMADESIRNKVTKIYNYDGPGHIDEFIDAHRDAYAELKSKEENYYPKDSIIGRLLNNNQGNDHFIDSNTDDIFQEHDSWNFKVETNSNGEYSFTDAGGQSELSKLIDDTLDDAMRGLSIKEKEAVLKAMMGVGLPYMISKGFDLKKEDWIILFERLVSNEELRSEGQIISFLKAIDQILRTMAAKGFITLTGYPGLDAIQNEMLKYMNDFLRNVKNTITDVANSVISRITGNADNKEDGSSPVYSFRRGSQWNESMRNVEFRVDTEKILQLKNEMLGQIKELKVFKDEVEDIINQGIQYYSSFPVKKIQRIRMDIRNYAYMFETQQNSLVRITERYQKAEKRNIQV